MEDRVASSQFFFTLSETGADYLNNQHAVFGHVVEGLDVLDALNTQLVDDDNRPFRDIRIKHTIVLDDPFPDPPSIPAALLNPARSPSPPADMLRTARIGEDEDVLGTQDDGEAEKAARDREAAARALTLEMIGDLPFAEIRPPENILFVCKLNPITRDEDLELIFSRFGEIRSCEIIRDKKTQDSLCYAFIDFEEKESAEDAYFKMDNVLVDDRRIHVDFSQSVSKLHQDFMVGKQQQRKKLGDGQEFGGTGLQKRRQYRDDEDEDENDDDGKRKGERGGERSGGRGYALVFDHDGTLEREKKRVREKSDVGSAGRDNGGRKRKDDEEEERRFEKISTSGSSQRRDEERHYYSERSNRNGSGGGLRKGDYIFGQAAKGRAFEAYNWQAEISLGDFSRQAVNARESASQGLECKVELAADAAATGSLGSLLPPKNIDERPAPTVWPTADPMPTPTAVDAMLANMPPPPDTGGAGGATEDAGLAAGTEDVVDAVRVLVPMRVGGGAARRVDVDSALICHCLPRVRQL
ncbi:Peptidyl-prolyl cis-trans isomerase cyp6 [Physocladia obscura]|uniref:Peptidyl-prolyl cis-trans isomerase n=1 Tax=Physocladia obscura TaxID=109957 RepID=A0AAD5SVH0_9FUNG|nr:Peptidyl-prolyl cis-trans isomerase cyp6 [Physocladia obscura]